MSAEVAQQAPGSTVEVFLQLMGSGQTRKACELIDRELLEVLEEQGGCEAYASNPSYAAEAKRLGGARVNEDKISVIGNTATLELGAATLAGEPVEIPVERLVRYDGLWWVTSG